MKYFVLEYYYGKYSQQEGEVLVVTDSAFHGYLNNPEATAESFAYDENNVKWLRTGDMGLFNEERLYLKDRLKMMIKYKGHQVGIYDDHYTQRCDG